MLRLVVVIQIALAAAGCRDEGLARLEGIRDEVCRCKEPACGEAALEKVKEGKVASNARTQKLANEMMDCLAGLYAQGRPETGPDVETAPAP